MKPKNESGQVLAEVILWVCVFVVSALTFAKLSNRDFGKYRNVLHSYSPKNTVKPSSFSRRWF